MIETAVAKLEQSNLPIIMNLQVVSKLVCLKTLLEGQTVKVKQCIIDI